MKTTRPSSSHIRTSISHPIYADWIEGIERGRVGLTFAPGKHSTSFYESGVLWRRDLAIDLDDLVRHGVTDLVCLLPDSDLARLQIAHLVDEATTRRLQVHRFPIVDQGVPQDRKALVDLLATLQQRLSEGASVVIHCEGGKGRSGVVAGCLLASLGVAAPEALRRLRKARGPHCPENASQRAFIERFAADARPWGHLEPGTPRTSGALTLFLLAGEDAPAPPALMLEEALARGVATVREASGHTHVTLDNHGDLSVLCLAGDLVKGGKQDRVLQHNFVIPPHLTGLTVDAFCVEHSRWGARHGDPSDRFRATLDMAPARLRRHLVTGTNQGAVWQEVEHTQERMGRSRGRAMRDARSESSLGLSLDLPEIQAATSELLRPFLDGLEGRAVRGYVAFIDGLGWQMEWFATRALWQASAPRLLRALAVEALGAINDGRRRPDEADARRWLSSLSVLPDVSHMQVSTPARQRRVRGEKALALTPWTDGRVLHGVAVG